MAPRTLSSTWKQFEKLEQKRTGNPDKDQVIMASVDELIERVNGSKTMEALASLFVHPYHNLEETKVALVNTRAENCEFTTKYLKEEKTVLVDPMSVFQFCESCREASEALRTQAARQSFYKYRYQAYLDELSKLPSQYYLLIQV